MPRSGSARLGSEIFNNRTIKNKPADMAARRHTRGTLATKLKKHNNQHSEKSRNPNENITEHQTIYQ